MTKAEIVQALYSKVGGFSRKESAELVDLVFEMMKETLGRGEKIKVSGFGNFVLRDKRQRPGRNPQTGQPIKISERRVLTFKASQILKQALNLRSNGTSATPSAVVAAAAAAALERRGLPPKLYFRIGEVAELVGVEPHVLRYWEREFRTIRPTKSAKGQRVYSRRDVENLMRVRELLYKEGFTIAGAKKKLVAGASRDEDRESFEPESDTAPGPATTTATDGDARVPPALGDDPGRTRDQLLAMRDEIESFLTELG
jgi:integration host factor subunit alpha